MDYELDMPHDLGIVFLYVPPEKLVSDSGKGDRLAVQFVAVQTFEQYILWYYIAIRYPILSCLYIMMYTVYIFYITV